jgi:hypothetical protein
MAALYKNYVQNVVREIKKYYTELRRRGIPYIQNKRKSNWIGCILCRNCLLKHVVEGKIEEKLAVKERRRG